MANIPDESFQTTIKISNGKFYFAEPNGVILGIGQSLEEAFNNFKAQIKSFPQNKPAQGIGSATDHIPSPPPTTIVSRETYRPFFVKLTIIVGILFLFILMSMSLINRISSDIKSSLKESDLVTYSLPHIMNDIRWLSDPTMNIPEARKEKIVSRIRKARDLFNNISSIIEEEDELKS